MDINQAENQTETATNEVAETETPKLESIVKAYFPSAEIEKAGEAIALAQSVALANNVEVTYNFDIEKDFEAGYGIAIDHIAKRGANGNEIIGILVAGVPDFETVMDAENGSAFVKDSVIDKMLAKLKNAVRPRGEDNTVSASVPFTIVDFITSNRPEGILIAFNDLAPAYVKMLKKKGLSLMTVAILRQTLQSSAFATQNFPKIDQEKWLTILDSMIAKATKDGKAVGILVDWKTSRNSAELKDADVDLSDLDFDTMAVETAPKPETVEAVES